MLMLASLSVVWGIADAQVSAGSSAAEAAERRCPSVNKTGWLEGKLPRLFSRFKEKRSLRVVALGSSSTTGAGASNTINSYPSQLERALRDRLPEREIVVINAGINGQEAPEMLARLDRDVIDAMPDLVIWQFGSNGLLIGKPIDLMETTIRSGIDRIHAFGADVVLLDLQHVPRIDALPARDQLLGMTRRLALDSSTALFHRYRLMRSWADSMGEQYAQMVNADQLHMTDFSYRCMAQVLADALVQKIMD